MTEATGSQNQNPQPNKAPWEQAWNDVKNGLSIIGEAMSDTFIPKTPPDMPSPWERMWGSDKPKEKPAVAAPKQAATTDGSWDEINKKYAQGQGDRDKAQLAILQSELANETNPKNIASLKREIARVGKGTSNKAYAEGATGDYLEDNRKELEALPITSAKEVLATGFNKVDARNKWVDKMEVEFQKAIKGKSRQERDKMWSNSWYYAKEKHPKDAAAFMHFYNQNKDEDIPVNAQSFLETYNPDMSFTSADLTAKGWVYADKGDRVYMAASGDVSTMVHETEHMRQQKDWKELKDQAPHTRFGAIGKMGEPIARFKRLTLEMKDDPDFKKVWRAENSHDSSNEWLANLQAFWKTGIPEGKSWSDTGMYKKLVQKVGKEEAHTMMLDALMTLQRADYTKKR